MKLPNHPNFKPSKKKNTRSVNWNQVFYFSEIAKFGSIKAAAQVLELTSSTLSLHLSQLEEDLAVKLFSRQHRKLTLTAEGSRLFQHAKIMFEAGRYLIDAVSQPARLVRPVAVGLVPTPSITIANQVLGKLFVIEESINMKVFRTDYSELENGISDGRFDFGFSDRVPDSRDLVHQRVSQASIKFFVSERWEQIPFSKLIHRLPLLICNPEPLQRSFVEQSLLESGLLPTSVVTSDYPSTLLDLCHQGIGIGVFSETPMHKLSTQGLTSLRNPPGAPKLIDSLFVLWSKYAHGAGAVKLLKQALADADLLKPIDLD